MIGIKSGAVLQRGIDDHCNIIVYGVHDVCCKYGSEYPDKYACAEYISDNKFRITGIPTGGPYCVAVNDMVFKEVYVGDVWLLAGQSNMEGNGVYRPDDTQVICDEIRSYSLEGVWQSAAHPTHLPIRARDNIHRLDTVEAKKEWKYKGVGPGVAFAKRMQELTGVPQGIVCCAKGGSTMEDWSPNRRDEAGNSLYGSLLMSLKDTGSCVAGLFWSQGCSEGMSSNKDIGDYYTNSTVEFFTALRKDLNRQIPIVQMQLCRIYGLDPEIVGESFTAVREAQRTMNEKVKGILTVPTVHLKLDDIVHLSADSQQIFGTQAAEAMHYLVFGAEAGILPPIEYSGYHITKDENTDNAIITVEYKNVSGILEASVRPMGFSVSDERLKVKNNRVFDVVLNGNSVILRLAAKYEHIKGLFLGYGCGAAPDCNITDAMGRSIPAMAGIEIKSTCHKE